MYLYSVGTALSNLCTYRRMTEGPILIDPFFFLSSRKAEKVGFFSKLFATEASLYTFWRLLPAEMLASRKHLRNLVKHAKSRSQTKVKSLIALPAAMLCT